MGNIGSHISTVLIIETVENSFLLGFYILATLKVMIQTNQLMSYILVLLKSYTAYQG